MYPPIPVSSARSGPRSVGEEFSAYHADLQGLRDQLLSRPDAQSTLRITLMVRDINHALPLLEQPNPGQKLDSAAITDLAERAQQLIDQANTLIAEPLEPA